MTPEDLGKIRKIFEEALTLSGSEREAFLERECHGDDAVRDEVGRLLKSRDNAPAWLDRPALGAAKPFVNPGVAQNGRPALRRVHSDS